MPTIFSPDDLAETPILRWFTYDHLPVPLQAISKVYSDAAFLTVVHVEKGAERTVALRKLLEAKDAAVRGYLESPKPVRG
ncbi:MAG: hypothetical protein E6R03_00150 [Hyphomicrobiaceae bacterium]|nr:MAG: hypothetical protein E6R03_00150 [Hyphomicrobiaceae bacterium]